MKSSVKKSVSIKERNQQYAGGYEGLFRRLKKIFLGTLIGFFGGILCVEFRDTRQKVNWTCSFREVDLAVRSD